jgi:hypothetical protein
MLHPQLTHHQTQFRSPINFPLVHDFPYLKSGVLEIYLDLPAVSGKNIPGEPGAIKNRHVEVTPHREFVTPTVRGSGNCRVRLHLEVVPLANTDKVLQTVCYLGLLAFCPTHPTVAAVMNYQVVVFATMPTPRIACL